MAVFFVVGPAAAQVNLGLTPEIGGEIGLATTDIRIIVARIIQSFFGLLGIIAVVLILYGGFLWMTSQGEVEKIDKAKRILVNAVIGLAIMLSAVAIAQFVINSLIEATTGGGGRGPGGGMGAAPVPLSGALGNGIIEAHYPPRDATNIPRNTRITVTFKEPMLISSFIRGYDDGGTPTDTSDDTAPAFAALEDGNVRVVQDIQGASPLASDQVRVGFTSDLKTFVFDPVPLLGSPSEDVGYLVRLTGGDTGILTADGDPAFAGSFAEGYQWGFETGTFVDNTPPTVLSVIPFAGSTNPRNIIIQVNFSEAMDPTTVTGNLPGFQNLRVESGGGPVGGSFGIGNGYRTIEFVTDDLCGTNSCGADVFCLPGGERISAVVRAATLGLEPPASDPAIVPSNGATDMTGNSLDGSADGIATGPDADNYAWVFNTSNAIDLTPPVIESIAPGVNEGSVMPDRPVTVAFSKLMSLLSFNSQSIRMNSQSIRMEAVPAPNICFYLTGDHLDETGVPAGAGVVPVRSQAVINHCLFLPETYYIPNISSKVTDVLQNCFYPGAASTAAAAGCTPGSLAGRPYCCNGIPCDTACEFVGGAPICGGP